MARYKCSVCGASSEKEQCWKHLPKKPLAKTGGFKRSGKKLVAKQKTEGQKMEIVNEIEKQWQFFLEIWNERPHYSEISGKWLGHEPLSVFFDHAIEKSIRPDLKYEKENIILCTFIEHQLRTNGFALPKHQELIEKAKQRFGIL